MKSCIIVTPISLENFKIGPFKLKTRLNRTSIKRTVAGMDHSNYPKLQHSHLQLQKISAKTYMFTAKKHEKIILAVIEIWLIMSFSLGF